MNGSHNKDTWAVYKQMHGIQCRRLSVYEIIGNLNYLHMDNEGSEGGRKKKSNYNERYETKMNDRKLMAWRSR